MIELNQLRNFFPEILRNQQQFQKYLLKEYLQLMMLDFLSTQPLVKKLCFIGGTNLRLVKGIDRFSEVLNFDCKELSKGEFIELNGNLLTYLRHNGLQVEIRDKDNSRLKAFRSSFYFPSLLYELGISVYKKERFLIKIECQDQQIPYRIKTVNIKGCGFYFPFPVPPDEVLCSMKLSAMLTRHKGRDFYDAQFLLAQTEPDYSFLEVRHGIHSLKELKAAVDAILQKVNLELKLRDFERLLFLSRNGERILNTGEFFNDLK
jgi:predicted nucleotidyltransferase component of viral defense system